MNDADLLRQEVLLNRELINTLAVALNEMAKNARTQQQQILLLKTEIDRIRAGKYEVLK